MNMIKNVKCKLLVLLFSFSISTSALAGWISAEEFRLGLNVTEIFENVTLNWIKNEKDKPRQYLPSLVVNPPADYFRPELRMFHDKYFGSAIGATTYNLRELIIGNPDNPGRFEALSITFDRPTRFFGYQAENLSGDLMMIATYDEEGALIDQFVEGQSSGRHNEAGRFVKDFSYTYNFDHDVSSIILGGTDSASYIYSLAFVPEPSAVLLMILGLLSLVVTRKLKLSRLEK